MSRYFVVPAPGYYGARTRVLSSHSTLQRARQAATGRAWVVRVGAKRHGDLWLQVYEGAYPIADGGAA